MSKHLPSLEIRPICCSCTCRNVVIHGQALGEGEKPQILKNDYRQLQIKPVFVVHPGDIKVVRLDRVVAQAGSATCYDFLCSKCQTGFRIVLGKEFAYVHHLPNNMSRCRRHISNPQVARPLSIFYPINLKRFISVTYEAKTSPVTVPDGEHDDYIPENTYQLDDESLQNNDDDEQEDYDIMFSCNDESFVGSYVAHYIK